MPSVRLRRAPGGFSFPVHLSPFVGGCRFPEVGRFRGFAAEAGSRSGTRRLTGERASGPPDGLTVGGNPSVPEGICLFPFSSPSLRNFSLFRQKDLPKERFNKTVQQKREGAWFQSCCFPFFIVAGFGEGTPQQDSIRDKISSRRNLVSW